MKQAVVISASLVGMLAFILAFAFIGDRPAMLMCLAVALPACLLSLGLAGEPRRECQAAVLRSW